MNFKLAQINEDISALLPKGRDFKVQASKYGVEVCTSDRRVTFALNFASTDGWVIFLTACSRERMQVVEATIGAITAYLKEHKEDVCCLVGASSDIPSVNVEVCVPSTPLELEALSGYRDALDRLEKAGKARVSVCALIDSL